MPEPSRTFQRVILACVLATYLITALYAAHYKYEILIWDDAEYVAHALDTVDQVQAYGVPSWLAFIAIHQHYAKPPLYVNSLALFNLFVGRLRTPLAIGLLAAVTSALVGLLAFRLIRPVTSFWFGILSMLAIAGLPAVARWAPAAYPDMLLALCVLWVIIILVAQPRTRWLGVALGAGLLAKFSFPLFVAGPILYWFWQGKQDRATRARLILRAGLIGGALALVWYWGNLSEALEHAKDSYGYSDRPNPVFLGALAGWLKVSAIDGIGLIIVTLAGIAALALVAGRRKPAAPFPAGPFNMLLAGALPAFLITLTSPLPDNRRLLPSYILFALAFLLTIFWIARTSRVRGILWALLIAGVLGQWTVAQWAQIPWLAWPVQNSALGPKLVLLGPALMDLYPASMQYVNEVLNESTKLGAKVPPRWYVSGYDGYFNIPRLQLAAKIRGIPIDFDWAEYYTWTEEQVVSRIKEISTSSAILLVVHPPMDSDLAQHFARNAGIVRKNLGEFRSLGEGNLVSMFATNSAYEAMQAPSDLIQADYSGRIQLLQMKISGRTLSLRLKLLTPLPCRYKLMVHAFGVDGVLHAWDRDIDPPLCKWLPAETRLMTFELPEAYVQSPYRLESGFFDEADSAHHYPPLKVTGGGNSVCVPASMAAANVLCPVGQIDLNRRP